MLNRPRRLRHSNTGIATGGAALKQQQDAETRMQTQTQIHRQLHGYRLTTAEILYHLPDHPAVLQSYTWQQLDIAPGYPELHKFLKFWTREIEGKLHSVRVGAVTLITPPRWRHTDHVLRLH